MKPDCCKKEKSKKELMEITEFLKIVSDENRLKILCILRKGEKCVCEIWQYLEIPQNLTSHHLKILREFNLILSRRDGLKIFYSINKKVVKKYNGLLNRFLSFK